MQTISNEQSLPFGHPISNISRIDQTYVCMYVHIYIHTYIHYVYIYICIFIHMSYGPLYDINGIVSCTISIVSNYKIPDTMLIHYGNSYQLLTCNFLSLPIYSIFNKQFPTRPGSHEGIIETRNGNTLIVGKTADMTEISTGLVDIYITRQHAYQSAILQTPGKGQRSLAWLLMDIRKNVHVMCIRCIYCQGQTSSRFLFF